jgi:hypothetical protein
MCDTYVRSEQRNRKTRKRKMLTNEAFRKMVQPWLTGDDEADAKSLKKMFKGARLSLTEWRQVVAECK